MATIRTALLVLVAGGFVAGCYDEPVRVKLKEPGVYKGRPVAELTPDEQKARTDQLDERLERATER